MSAINFKINPIYKRGRKNNKNYSGFLGNFFKDGRNNLIYNKLDLNSEPVVIYGGSYKG